MLKSREGFTLTEALATVIIVGLVTCILASGIALATRQYTQTMSMSEGQMLYSSLQKILETELGYTSSYTSDGNNEDGGVNVTGFSSKHYKAKSDDNATGSLNPVATENVCTLADGDSGVTIQDMNVPGRLAMCSADGKVTNPFLGTGSYNYGLQAYVGKLTYNKGKRMFTVGLGITKNGDTASPLIYETFTVRALNLDMPSGGSNTGGSGSIITEYGIPAVSYPDVSPAGGLSITRGSVYYYRGTYYVATTEATFHEYYFKTPADADVSYLFAVLPASPTIIDSSFFDESGRSSALRSGMVFKNGNDLYLRTNSSEWGQSPLYDTSANWVKIQTG